MLGEGIAKGFVETARNFFGSYYNKDRRRPCNIQTNVCLKSRRREIFPFLSMMATIGKRGCVA